MSRFCTRTYNRFAPGTARPDLYCNVARSSSMVGPPLVRLIRQTAEDTLKGASLLRQFDNLCKHSNFSWC